MAKIGTAHIEIKPVINDEALAAIMQRIEDAIAEGVARGLRKRNTVQISRNWLAGAGSITTYADMDDQAG